MRFSILINCHNQANYIDECILSSLNQNYENFEVIVVDSSDIKLNLEKFKSHENFKYFHIERFSKYPEVNQMYKVELGFKESSGDYICLLDADDKFSDKKLNKLNEYIKYFQSIYIYLMAKILSFLSFYKMFSSDSIVFLNSLRSTSPFPLCPAIIAESAVDS